MLNLWKVPKHFFGVFLGKRLAKLLDLHERRKENESAEWDAHTHPTGMRKPGKKIY
jgi:hypothetical protein